MTDVGRFGVFLPSYVWEGDGPERARGIKTFARRVEELGFDSLFITDHLLAAKRFYSVNWLEPLTTLAVAAGATERVRLGTSILIMPLRNPVILAKELATLQFLSDNRVILGAGVGWNEVEYEAVGVHKSERGKRTDEMLDIMMPLLEGERSRYHGEFYDVDDVFIEPRTSQRPLLWIGGGSQLADPKSPDVPRVRRVGQGADRQGRWLDPSADLPAAGHRARLAGAPDRDARGRQGPVGLPRRARELPAPGHDRRPGQGARGAAPGVPQGHEQRARTETTSSRSTCSGRPDEIIASLQARVDAGVEYFFLHTMTPDPDQLQLWVDEIIPNVTFPATAGPGPPPADPLAAMTRRVGLIGKPLKRRHSQVMHDAAFDAAGIDARYVLLELEPEAVEAAVREARGPDWLGLGVTAPYKRVVAGLRRRGRGRRRDDRRRQQRRPDRRRAPRRVQHRRAGVPGRRRARDGPAARRRRRRRRRGRRGRACGRVRLPSSGRAAGDRRESDGRVGLGARRALRRCRDRAPGRRSRWPTRRSRRRCGPRTWRSTRRPSGCSIPGATIPVDAAAGDGDRVRPRLRPARDAAPRGRPGRAACARPTGRRCSSRRPPSRSSAGPGVGGMADVMRAAVAPLLADATARA